MTNTNKLFPETPPIGTGKSLERKAVLMEANMIQHLGIGVGTVPDIIWEYYSLFRIGVSKMDLKFFVP